MSNSFLIPVLVGVLIAFFVIFILVLQSVRGSLLAIQEQFAASSSAAEKIAERAQHKAVEAYGVADSAKRETGELRKIVTPRIESVVCKKCNGRGLAEVVHPSPLVAEIHASLVKRFGVK